MTERDWKRGQAFNSVRYAKCARYEKYAGWERFSMFDCKLFSFVCKPLSFDCKPLSFDYKPLSFDCKPLSFDCKPLLIRGQYGTFVLVFFLKPCTFYTLQEWLLSTKVLSWGIVLAKGQFELCLFRNLALCTFFLFTLYILCLVHE